MTTPPVADGKRASPACPLCGETNGEYRFSERGYDLIACRGCQLLFIDPYGDRATVLDRASRDDYSDLEILRADAAYRASRETYTPWYPRIARLCASAESVLDVGCGTGYLLERLSEFPALRRVGLELNHVRADFARKKTGCPIVGEPLETFEDRDGFDVIVLMDVLSHIPAFEFFAAAKRLLRPNGRLVLKTGECASDIRRADIHDWGIPNHVHFLGLSTMQRIADQYGFAIVEHDRIPMSKVVFSPGTMRARGRSRFRNLMKQSTLIVPGTLPLLARAYDALRGRRIFTSFIVLGHR